jgi:nitroimidazol reductase NimA-like FMN-containing flavoprotein (pyridoxamine 5'-phosphate oxidase superfamily)
MRCAMPFPPALVEALRSAKQINVGTRRADGTPSKSVPVWFMLEGDALYFTTAPGSHKARRIARGKPILIWVGGTDGPPFRARAGS